MQFRRSLHPAPVSIGKYREILLTQGVRKKGSWFDLSFPQGMIKCVHRFAQGDFGEITDSERAFQTQTPEHLMGKYTIGREELIIIGYPKDSEMFVMLREEYE